MIHVTWPANEKKEPVDLLMTIYHHLVWLSLWLTAFLTAVINSIGDDGSIFHRT